MNGYKYLRLPHSNLWSFAMDSPCLSVRWIWFDFSNLNYTACLLSTSPRLPPLCRPLIWFAFLVPSDSTLLLVSLVWIWLLALWFWNPDKSVSAFCWFTEFCWSTASLLSALWCILIRSLWYIKYVICIFMHAGLKWSVTWRFTVFIL